MIFSPPGAMPPPRAVLTLPPAGLTTPSERPSTASTAVPAGATVRPATARKKGVSFMDQLVEAMEDVNQHLNNTTTTSRPATASAAADPSHGALVTVPLPPEGSRRRPASASARACPSRPLTSSQGTCLTLGDYNRVQFLLLHSTGKWEGCLHLQPYSLRSSAHQTVVELASTSARTRRRQLSASRLSLTIAVGTLLVTTHGSYALLHRAH